MGIVYKRNALVLYKPHRISKLKKLCKNLLTNGNESAIICKLSDSWAVVERVTATATEKKESRKKLKKLLKNLLTNARECDIILGHFLTGKKERLKSF